MKPSCKRVFYRTIGVGVGRPFKGTLKQPGIPSSSLIIGPLVLCLGMWVIRCPTGQRRGFYHHDDIIMIMHHLVHSSIFPNFPHPLTPIPTDFIIGVRALFVFLGSGVSFGLVCDLAAATPD